MAGKNPILDELDETMSVIDKAFSIPTGKVGDCLVVGTSAQRLRSSENVPSLLRYFSRARSEERV